MPQPTPNQERTRPASAAEPAGSSPAARMSAGGRGLPGLVGRAREVVALRAALAEAAAGRGGVVAIGGEPGIGKTRLAQAAAALAREAGGGVRWGRCDEGEWAPPYGPWAEILAEHADADPARLRADLAALGPAAAPLSRLLPALGDLLPGGGAAAALSPEEERFRLHDAVARLLAAAAAERPLLLVLDDLQWADRPSLALLTHLARGLDRCRMLVVVTYRDGALDRDHPLTEALAALRREAGFASLTLKGLDRGAVVELLAQATRREVSPELGRAIHGETGGNPFYVGEVMRHLVDQGAVVAREGRWAAAEAPRAPRAPEGVRQVVGHRLGRLGAPTRRLLDRAAVFTAGVDFAVLRELTGLPEGNCWTRWTRRWRRSSSARSRGGPRRTCSATRSSARRWRTSGGATRAGRPGSTGRRRRR